MTESDIEVVKRGFEAFNQRGVNGILEFIHPEFETSTPPELASEPDTYRGHDGVKRYFDSFYEAMDEIRWEAHSFEEAGDRVIVDFTLHARGRATGIDTELHAVQVWELHSGKAIGLELYPTLEQARAAVAERR